MATAPLEEAPGMHTCEGVDNGLTAGGGQGTREALEATLVAMTGGDPFVQVIEAASKHRAAHGPRCELFPAGPLVMRLAATVARAVPGTRILDLGTGFGYSAFWFAAMTAPDVRITAVDRWPEHIRQARVFAEHLGFANRVQFIVGETSDVLPSLGVFDQVHDDAWFVYEPPHLQEVLQHVRPGGVVTMPNWFLLEDAINGRDRPYLVRLYGDDWAEELLRYAARLASDPAISVTWSLSPALAIVVTK